MTALFLTIGTDLANSPQGHPFSEKCRLLGARVVKDSTEEFGALLAHPSMFNFRRESSAEANVVCSVWECDCSVSDLALVPSVTVISGQAAIEMGSRLFAMLPKDSSLFPNVEGTAAPGTVLHLLSQDGLGVFLEDRVVWRLEQLGFLESQDRVKAIRDCGGWKSLDDLTARLEVSVDGEAAARVLLVTALLPPPPLTTDECAKIIRQRHSYLSLLNVPTTYLAAERGHWYRNGLVVPLADYVAETSEHASWTIARQLAYVAAIIDSGALEYGDISIGELDGIEYKKYLMLTGGIDSLTADTGNLASVFATDGETVYWDDLSHSFASIVLMGTHSSHAVLSKMIWSSIRPTFEKYYREYLLECSQDGWRDRQLRSH